MRYAIISDVHANIEALSAVFDAIDALGVDTILCLGDIVGRFASPNECLDALRERRVRSISGNHDRAAVGTKDMTHWGERAKRAILFTRAHLTAENRRFLRGLPMLDAVDNRLLMFHAALHPEPNDDIYMFSEEPLLASLNALRLREGGIRLGFFGHTHVPGVHRLRLRPSLSGNVESSAGAEQKLLPDSVYLVNPGSVGQPRDRDLRASFLIYDAPRATIRFHRVEFDRRSCTEKLLRAGLLHRAPTPPPSSSGAALAPAPGGAATPRPPSSPAERRPRLPRRPRAGGGDAPHEGSLGAHGVRFEPPDLVFSTYVGDASEAQVTEISLATSRFARGKRWLLAICDMTLLGAVSAGALAAMVRATSLTRGAAFIHASTRPQVLHALLAASLGASHREGDIPLLFFDTEAEARAWIDERRRALAAKEPTRR